MLVSAAIRPNPQAALQTIQTRFRRSNLEMRGPRNGLKDGTRSFRGVNSVPLFAQIPNLHTN
eukprot:9382552-Alexandrium_andersonii.AAC.1